MLLATSGAAPGSNLIAVDRVRGRPGSFDLVNGWRGAPLAAGLADEAALLDRGAAQSRALGGLASTV
ncbi:hypothetical protein ACFQHO_28550 [Actinomadura yumaensis]|uniref:hypothetical protein n=1 Tax=Actinomadura yumaensis TaxID=111807 RepID=UPI00360B2F8F